MDWALAPQTATGWLAGVERGTLSLSTTSDLQARLQLRASKAGSITGTRKRVTPCVTSFAVECLSVAFYWEPKESGKLSLARKNSSTFYIDSPHVTIWLGANKESISNTSVNAWPHWANYISASFKGTNQIPCPRLKTCRTFRLTGTMVHMLNSCQGQ